MYVCIFVGKNIKCTLITCMYEEYKTYTHIQIYVRMYVRKKIKCTLIICMY